MKVLLFSASLRKESLNTKLNNVIQSIVKEIPEITIEVVNIKSLNIPVYDGDIEERGMPEGVVSLGRSVHNADAIIISSPEYNGSISAPLKNLVDWVSRIRPIPWEKKPILLTGASTGALGSMRALIHSKDPFETLGSYVYPNTFALSKAHEAFSENGTFKDEKQMSRLKDLINHFIQFAKKLN